MLIVDVKINNKATGYLEIRNTGYKIGQLSIYSAEYLSFGDERDYKFQVDHLQSLGPEELAGRALLEASRLMRKEEEGEECLT